MWDRLKSINLKYVLLGIFLIVLLMQVIGIDQTEPRHLAADDILVAEAAPIAVVNIMHSACYDCHSYETKYPWYSSVAPISWWTKNHVNEARENLNFSDWTHFSLKRQHKKLYECIEEVKESEMPLASYTYIHKDAKLTQDQRQILINWFESILAE